MPGNGKSKKVASKKAPGEKKKAPSEDVIRERAYERFLRRGGEPGKEQEDWQEAERELREG